MKNLTSWIKPELKNFIEVAVEAGIDGDFIQLAMNILNADHVIPEGLRLLTNRSKIDVG